jgi:hypothetical protein
MAPQIGNTVLNEAALRRLLTNSALSLVYLESSTRVVLRRLDDFIGSKSTLPPVHWQYGRAFGPTLEIRWAPEGDLFGVMVLTENLSLPTLSEGWLPNPWVGRLDPTPRKRDILLYGVNTGAGTWHDPRLPHLLDYPIGTRNAERVVLKVLDYTAHGLVVLTRFCELAAYQKPPDEKV